MNKNKCPNNVSDKVTELEDISSAIKTLEEFVGMTVIMFVSICVAINTLEEFVGITVIVFVIIWVCILNWT